MTFSPNIAPPPASIAPPELDELCVNTLHFLAVDAVQKAKSGNPGLPLGLAAMACPLSDRPLEFNPRDPFTRTGSGDPHPAQGTTILPT
jgi:hypothetical protein